MSISEEDYSDSDIMIKMRDLDLNKENRFINLKGNGMEIKSDINPNPNITDIPSSSNNPPKEEIFNKPPRGYAGVSSTTQINDKYTPFDKMRGEPINPFGIYLDLDCINNTEEAIDKWETALRIAVTINKMDIETTKHFIERSLLNSVLRYWQNLTPEVTNIIIGTDENISNIITRAVETIKLEFCGEGNIYKNSQTIEKYKIALMRLQLCDICEIERYICVFQDYYYHIYNKTNDTGYFLSLFFSKIPDPWGQKLIETYNPDITDTLGKRISHVKDKMSEWCSNAILAKATKGLRKRVTLCCDKPSMPLLIGCDSSYYYGKIKRKYKKRKHFKRKYFKRRKSTFYKKQKYKKSKQPFYKRKYKKAKECRCFYCKEIGHYADKCPKRQDKNKKIFEVDDELIDQGEFLQINEFEELTTDESIFILTETEYTSSSENE